MQNSSRAEGNSAKRDVVASVNYIKDDVKDLVYHSESVSADKTVAKKTNMAARVETVMPMCTETVTFEDLRDSVDSVTLDREGICLVSSPTIMVDFRNHDEFRRVHLKELHDVVKAVTGAEKVIIGHDTKGQLWGHRISDRAAQFGEKGTSYPGRFAHVDYSDAGGEAAIREMLADDPDTERLLAGRYAIYNLWRAISDPPQDCPLGLCDARSVEPEDLIVSRTVRGEGKDRVEREANFVRYNPTHRWVYFRDMTRDELLIFRGFESDPARSMRVPHTAFDDPLVGLTAPPRESIDLRCAVFYGNA